MSSRMLAGGPFAILAIIISLILAACQVSVVRSQSGPDGGDVEWTYLVYMAADSRLEQYALEDLNEIEAGLVNWATSSCYSLLDRSPAHDTSDGDWSGTRLFRMTGDPAGMDGTIHSVQIASEELGTQAAGSVPLNMGSGNTIASFLAWARQVRPADRLALVLWGVTEGTRGFCRDDGSDDELSIAELGAALSRYPVDLLVADASFGARFELIAEVEDSVGLFVAPAGIVSGTGLDYRRLFEALDSAQEPAEVAAAVFQAMQDASPWIDGPVLAAPRAAGEFRAAFASLCGELYALVDVQSARQSLRDLLFEEVDGYFVTPGDLDLEIESLLTTVADNYAELRPAVDRAREALRLLVIDTYQDPIRHPGALGVTLHFVPLSDLGTPLRHDNSYFRGSDSEPKGVFVETDPWAPIYPDGPGLLYRLWYELF